MARFGVIGDLHGNSRWGSYVLDELGRRSIQHAFVVGDFGLWPGFWGVQFLDSMQEAAARNSMSVLAIPGNHESFDILEHYQAHAPRHKGFSYLRERVLMCGKVNSFNMFGKKFVVAGGAVSIDKEYRLAREKGGQFYDRQFGHTTDLGKGTGPRTLWWDQEQLTDDEEDKIKSFGKCDILLTHDCSDKTPWKNRLKPDMDSQFHRGRIDRILRAVQPEVQFHGHMHELYHWDNLTGDDHYTETWGLDCDGNAYSWGVFDTDLMEFDLRGESFQYRSLG